MDLFFDLFLAELGEFKRRIHEERESGHAERAALADLSRAMPLVEIDGAVEDAPLAAVDGGVWTVDLIDGRRMALSRAIAVGPYNLTERSFKIDVIKSRGARGRLEIAEMEAALKAVRTKRIKYLLMDGSYRVRAVLRLGKMAVGRISDYAMAVKTLYLLAELLREAAAAGVKAVFVSKDHRSKILKEHVVFERLRGRINGDLAELGLRYYSLLWIGEYKKQLSKWRERLAGDPAASAAMASLFSPATDRAVLADMPPRTYTLPLLLGASDVRLAHVDDIEIVDAAEGKLRRAKRLGEIDDLDEYLDMLWLALSSLPKAHLLYLKPGAGSDPLLVEVPAPGRMFDGGPTKEFDPQADVGDVVALLASLYRDPVVYNVWLYQAHGDAAFKQRSLYFGYLFDEIGELLSRRARMAFGA